MGQRPKRIFLEPFNSLYRCKVCLDVFHDPHFINCGHSYCYSCIALLRTEYRPCLICQKYFQTVNLVPNIELNNIIAAFPTMCEFEQCNWTGTCYDLKAHRRMCQFREIKAKKPLEVHGAIDLEGADVSIDQDKWVKNKNELNFNQFQRHEFLPVFQPFISSSFGSYPYQNYLFPALAPFSADRRIFPNETMIRHNVFQQNKKSHINKCQGNRFDQGQESSDLIGSYSGFEQDFIPMVDESEFIQNPGSFDLSDPNKAEKQFILLPPTLTIYQPEKTEFQLKQSERVIPIIHSSSMSEHPMTTRSRTKIPSSHSQSHFLSEQPGSLKIKVETSAKSSNLLQDQAKSESPPWHLQN